MNTKYSSLACAAVVLGIVTNAPSAHAMGIQGGSTLNLSSFNGGGYEFLPGTGTLDFFSIASDRDAQEVSIGVSDGDFSPAASDAPPLATIVDLILNDDGGGIFSLAAPVNAFLSGIDLNGSTAASDNVTFNLTEFIFDSTTGGTSSLKGDFFVDGQFAAEGMGRFTSQLDLANPTTFSLSITAQPVPTPALLPGLLGFGATLMRKRKQSKQDSVTGGLTEAA